MIESTYGDRTRHVRTGDHRRWLLATTIEAAWRRGGPIVIPTFAIGRLQDLLFDLHILQHQQPRFFDGVDVQVVHGLGSRVSEAYAQVFAGADASLWIGDDVIDGFGRPYDGVLRTLLESILTCRQPVPMPSSHAHDRRLWRGVKLDEVKLKPQSLILVGGGMGAGPAETLLRRMVDMEQATALFVGYCAPGSLGGRLQAGHRHLRFSDGESRSVHFATRRLEGYSAHADRDALVDWAMSRHRSRASEAPVARRILITHGDDGARNALARGIGNAATRAGHSVVVELPTEGRAIPLEAGILATP